MRHRNSMHGKTIRLPRVTPAMALGFQPRAWSVRELPR
jgi:hypothetical protein